MSLYSNCPNCRSHHAYTRIFECFGCGLVFCGECADPGPGFDVVCPNCRKSNTSQIGEIESPDDDF
jgi:hypothetical protein